MKHHNMLPYRPLAFLVAALSIAPTSAQWGGQSQEYCSNQNTGSDYNSVSDTANSFQACSQACGDDYAFAIVQWENCWCSDYIPSDQGDTSDCNQSCPGYPDDKCGNEDQGLYGYIALGKSPSGTAGGGSSSQASSTRAASSTSERVSTSTSTSSRRERTSSSPPTSFSSTTPVASSSDPTSDSSSPRTSSSLTPSSQTSSSEATSSSRRPSTSSSDPPTTSSSSRTRTASSSSSTPPPETSTSSSSIVEELTTPTSSSSIPESATPSPVTSTRVVTISGEPVTQTVTSTPMVAPDRQASETDTSSPSTVSGGAIAGIVIGVLAFLALLALAIILLWRRKRKDPNDPAAHGYPEMSSQGTTRRPRRNVSVLSKVGLLARGHETVEDDNTTNDPSSAGAGAHSARHSAFYPPGSSHGEPSSPLGPQSQQSGSLYQMDSRRHSKPLVYDQRLNPSALFANADANGSRVSMADNTDYSRPLDGIGGGGRLQVRNPDPRASFESRA